MCFIIPAISTKQRNHPCGGFLFVDLVMNLRRYGFKKLSESIFNVRFLHRPEGVSLMDVANNSRHFPATKQLVSQAR